MQLDETFPAVHTNPQGGGGELRGHMREGLSRKEKQHKQRHRDRHVAYLGDFVFKHNTVLALQRHCHLVPSASQCSRATSSEAQRHETTNLRPHGCETVYQSFKPSLSDGKARCSGTATCIYLSRPALPKGPFPCPFLYINTGVSARSQACLPSGVDLTEGEATSSCS